MFLVSVTFGLTLIFFYKKVFLLSSANFIFASRLKAFLFQKSLIVFGMI